MTISPLPLSYCTNVHPGRSVEEVERGLDELTLPIMTNCGERLAAGLWLANPVVKTLLDQPENVGQFADRLAHRGLTCHSLNAFPYGDFHSTRVKENVYLPDWSQVERLEYTLDCARILAAVLPGGVEGTISTVPLGFKGFDHPEGFLRQSRENLLRTARFLADLREETGQVIRLAMEPEPFCLLETTAEVVAFFERLWNHADTSGTGESARRHIGLCYDVCHQAVEFEDIPRSIQTIDAAGIRINKLHISCAIQMDAPAEEESRRALATYVEPRYLHQTMALTKNGQVLRQIDLTKDLALEPPRDFLDAEQWRVHFHVPVNTETLGPLGTTRHELRQALSSIALLSYAPHLEVETYTWEVLPETRDGDGAGEVGRLIDGLTQELKSTRKLLGEFAQE